MEEQSYWWHYKRNISLAFPVMMSQLGHVMVGIADSLMVGQVGIEPLAAASFANAIFFFFLTFGLGVSYAITPFIAAADGENNSSRTAGYLKNGFLVNSVLGVILLVFLLAVSFNLHSFNQPLEVVELATPYFMVISLSIIPFMIFQTFRQFAEGLSLTKQAMYITISANFLNIALNYVLIFGKLGFPALGLVGAGIASLISRIFMAIFMWGFIYFSSRFRDYWKDFSLEKIRRSTINQLLKIGVPTGLQFIFEVGAFAIAAIMVGWLGAGPLAAHQIAINMASISYMMATGISAATTIRVGNQLGKKDIPTMRKAAFVSFSMVTIFMSLFALAFILGRDFWPSLYVDSDEVIGIASSLLIVAGFFQISDGVQVVGLGALRGMADVKIPTLYTLIAYWIVGLPVGYLLGFTLGLEATGIWYGLLIGLSVSAFLMFTRFVRISRRALLVQT